jgi:hypothetical protein
MGELIHHFLDQFIRLGAEGGDGGLGIVIFPVGGGEEGGFKLGEEGAGGGQGSLFDIVFPGGAVLRAGDLSFRWIYSTGE